MQTVQQIVRRVRCCVQRHVDRLVRRRIALLLLLVVWRLSLGVAVLSTVLSATAVPITPRIAALLKESDCGHEIVRHLLVGLKGALEKRVVREDAHDVVRRTLIKSSARPRREYQRTLRVPVVPASSHEGARVCIVCSPAAVLYIFAY